MTSVQTPASAVESLHQVASGRFHYVGSVFEGKGLQSAGLVFRNIRV